MRHKHGVWMILACVAMIALALLWPSFLRPSIGGLGAGWLFFLICPIMHVLMMVGLFGGKHCEHTDRKANNEGK